MIMVFQRITQHLYGLFEYFPTTSVEVQDEILPAKHSSFSSFLLSFVSYSSAALSLT